MNISKSKLVDYALNVALIGLVAYLAYAFSGLLYPSSRVATPAKAQVILYSTKWCPACIQTRSYFNQNKIAYFEYDVNHSDVGLRRFRQLGGVGVPLITVGNTVIHGLNKRKLNQALEQLRIKNSPAPVAK
jgi:glutaredoxin